MMWENKAYLPMLLWIIYALFCTIKTIEFFTAATCNVVLFYLKTTLKETAPKHLTLNINSQIKNMLYLQSN